MKNTTLINSLLCLTLLGGAASAETQFDFLWSPASARVMESASAGIISAVPMPPNAIQWKWDRVESQMATEKLFPRERAVIKPIEVVRANGYSDAELSVIDLRDDLQADVTRERAPLLSEI